MRVRGLRLGAQGDDGIDARSAMGGKICCDERHASQHDGHGGIGDRIRQADAEEKCRYDAREHEKTRAP